MALPQYKMPLSEFEEELAARVEEERRRRERVLRQAEVRARKREVDRTHKRGTLRFALLVLAIIATAVIVTVVMFRTLYVVMG